MEEIQNQKYTTDKRIKELEIQNSLLVEKLKVENEKKLDMAPFRNQASLLQKEINQILLKLAGDSIKLRRLMLG